MFFEESKTMLVHYSPLLNSPLSSPVLVEPIHIARFDISSSLNSRTRHPVCSLIFQKPKLYVAATQCLSSDETQITEETSREAGGREDEDEDFQVVSAIKSSYNDIVIIDTAGSRLLLLDQTHNIHSIFYKGRNDHWTNSYWDEFAALPPIVPPGPIAIYGLGGGTAAHLLLDSYPHLEIEGWEIDDVLVDKSREFLGLADLETANGEGGVLKVCVGDALLPSEEMAVDGKYAGIIVDLFKEGKVLEEMPDVELWGRVKRRLRPGGRVMVNCGGAENVMADAGSRGGGGGDAWVVNLTVQAMWEAFKGELCWKKMPRNEGENYMAMTGGMPELEKWEASVPEKLRAKVWGWMPFPNVPSQ
uniref:S-adenosyl-L-methionine-dependent methyltransferase n=1 Tax=Kalanchoe fedtschenkoi TaxID=63787 RepID=A0A7N0UVI8_KALFE